MAVLKWYCGECRKVLQVKMTFFVCIFRSKNIIFVPSAVRDCVSKVLVFLFHIYKMKTHKLLKRFQVYKRKVRFWNIFQFTTWKKHVSDTFFNFKTRKPPFWSSFILKNAKTRFWSVFFIFTKWKSSFLNCFSSLPHGNNLFEAFSVFKNEKTRFGSVFKFTKWKNTFLKHFSSTWKPPFWIVFQFSKIKKHVFQALLSLRNEKTRFPSVFKLTKWKKRIFELFFKLTLWKSPFWSVF